LPVYSFLKLDLFFRKGRLFLIGKIEDLGNLIFFEDASKKIMQSENSVDYRF